MFESDADRLAMIKSLGGQLVRHSAGEFWAIFDNASQDSTFEVDVEGTAPMLTARTIDVQQLRKGAVLRLQDGEYRIEKHEPDGTGMTRVVLSL